MMFKVLVLQKMNNFSNDKTEYQILDRFSFCRFLGIDLFDAVPDAKTIWICLPKNKRKFLLQIHWFGPHSFLHRATENRIQHIQSGFPDRSQRYVHQIVKWLIMRFLLQFCQRTSMKRSVNTKNKYRCIA